MASVFKYRGGWRAQANIPGRPHTDCRLRRDAEVWARDMEADHETGKAPRLGGPTRCNVAQMLAERARTYSIALDGRTAEFNRINHYLRGAGMPLLKPVCIEALLATRSRAFSSFGSRRIVSVDIHDLDAVRQCSTACVGDVLV